MILRLFHLSSWLLLMRFCCDIFKPASKKQQVFFFKVQVIFQWAIGFEVLRHITYVHASPNSGTSGRKTVCTKRVYKTDHAETFLFADLLNYFNHELQKSKQVCRKKATSSGQTQLGDRGTH